MATKMMMTSRPTYLALFLALFLTSTLAFVTQRQPPGASITKSTSLTFLSIDDATENATIISESPSFIDSIVQTGLKDASDLQVGDVVVAKIDVPALRIWSGSGYTIQSMFLKGANADTGMAGEIALNNFSEPSKNGYTKYLKLYNPRYHDTGPVLVTAEEIGLTTLNAELKEALLLAIPGFFWVFVAAAFVNWYGGSFWEAMFPASTYSNAVPSTALPNLLFLVLLILPIPGQSFTTVSNGGSVALPTTGMRSITALFSSSSSSDSTSPPIVVAMTREDGKNTKLLQQIQRDDVLSQQLELMELPCIAHADGPEYDQLAATLQAKSWDYVAVTSPEAAKVLASAWDSTNPLPVIAVGKATEKTLEQSGIPVIFTPSKATAKVLAKELDLKNGKGTTVLYPASARAKTTLQDGLSERGFAVTRLNTYNTVTAEWTQEQIQQCKRVQIACFASPSSIKGWLKNTHDNKDVYAACIGETSATACRKHGWSEDKILYPDAPGMEGWVEAIREAMEASKSQVEVR